MGIGLPPSPSPSLFWWSTSPSPSSSMNPIPPSSHPLPPPLPTTEELLSRCVCACHRNHRCLFAHRVPILWCADFFFENQTRSKKRLRRDSTLRFGSLVDRASHPLTRTFLFHASLSPSPRPEIPLSHTPRPPLSSSHTTLSAEGSMCDQKYGCVFAHFSMFAPLVICAQLTHRPLPPHFSEPSAPRSSASSHTSTHTHTHAETHIKQSLQPLHTSTPPTIKPSQISPSPAPLPPPSHPTPLPAPKKLQALQHRARSVEQYWTDAGLPFDGLTPHPAVFFFGMPPLEALTLL